jgi:hypothetical protein
VNCTVCPLCVLCTVDCVHRVLCPLCTVCRLCVLCTVDCVHRVLSTVSTVYCRLCPPCTVCPLSTVCRLCVLCPLCTVSIVCTVDLCTVSICALCRFVHCVHCVHCVDCVHGVHCVKAVIVTGGNELKGKASLLPCTATMHCAVSGSWPALQLHSGRSATSSSVGASVGRTDVARLWRCRMSRVA